MAEQQFSDTWTLYCIDELTKYLPDAKFYVNMLECLSKVYFQSKRLQKIII